MAEKAGTPRPHLRAVGSSEPDSAAPGEHSLQALIYSKPGHLVRRLQQFAGAIFLEETEAFGITPVQYAILAGVLSHPGVDQVGLARLIGFDRTTIGGVIDRLERKGLVERRLSPGDRRIRLLYPTLGGVDLLAAMYPATERAQRRLLQPLSDEEGEVFKALMGRIVSHHNADTRAPIDRERVRGPAGEAGED